MTADPRRPVVRGLAFGVSNQKAYPVAVATFTALLTGHEGGSGWGAFAPLLAAACAGLVVADAVLVSVIGAGVVQRFHWRHALWAMRVSGALFVGFGVHAIVAAGPGV